ncbi:MAG: hypothetical protein J3K34DRAFT_441978 [Monoraphidium minutum]|nr:MAG: hypothetical protein J3K34DRAFT_441978 [Monoraphidium minutum]
MLYGSTGREANQNACESDRRVGAAVAESGCGFMWVSRGGRPAACRPAPCQPASGPQRWGGPTAPGPGPHTPQRTPRLGACDGTRRGDGGGGAGDALGGGALRASTAAVAGRRSMRAHVCMQAACLVVVAIFPSGSAGAGPETRRRAGVCVEEGACGGRACAHALGLAETLLQLAVAGSDAHMRHTMGWAPEGRAGRLGRALRMKLGWVARPAALEVH